jgi:hypothetical protein
VDEILQQPSSYKKEWFALLKKMLQIEKRFYDVQKAAGKIGEVYWYPSLYHSSLLETIYQQYGDIQFMILAKLFFFFPREMELNETSNLVDIIKELSLVDEEAKYIIDLLVDKNPSKYWNLKNTN